VPTGWSDHVPAFLRGGAIIGLFNEHGMTVQETFKKNLTLYIARDESGVAEGALYFDDLVSMDHQNGISTRVTIQFTDDQLGVHPVGSYKAVPLVSRVVIYGTSQLPGFVIPGGTVALENGVVTVSGLNIDLSSTHEFTSQSGSSRGGLATGIVVLIVIAGLVVIVGTVALASLWVFRRRPAHSDEQKESPLLETK
jgi:hypothetical protein